MVQKGYSALIHSAVIPSEARDPVTGRLRAADRILRGIIRATSSGSLAAALLGMTLGDRSRLRDSGIW